MKNSLQLLLLTAPLFTLWFCNASSGKEKPGAGITSSSSVNNEVKSVAVLELFTSQGCSSCPPADRLLASYAAKQHVIALSFHVDYWDRLGWKDPFSSKAFTERQYKYATSLKAEVYTPQLIINGQSEMIGSEESKINASIKKIWSQEPVNTLSIKSLEPGNGKVNVNFVASGNIANALLNVAVVQKKAITEIKAGENGGVTLSDNNVVLNFETSGPVHDGANTASINIPAGMDQKNLSVVIFLQEKSTGKIGAADLAGW